jgi:hypothetical protein
MEKRKTDRFRECHENISLREFMNKEGIAGK